MEDVKSLETKNAKFGSWRSWRLTFGIWLIPFFLIPLSLPNYVVKGIFGAGLGLLFCASSPPFTIFKQQFSGPFVGAVFTGLSFAFLYAFIFRAG